ncbi:LpxI family protein [Selenomonas ruminantium]|jgi:DUF1009 family protein|uniref:DUF1009 domain-containing protein n=1 Tax=Selenomonas ruminantium TaxID=971 RepID=A0A1K1N015_SELRU|nr:UDP-2,3-diacylglucosamine diphosphatase LpxI [Selenomonas ruminantium]MBE6085141.1 DUF1009 domain-containing protein [Selenomonas ruminantium]SFA98490.1 hypothetical protein SAMN05216587_10578 [Selenomonas ruminantium]SFW28699.1 hypothetical protein SAMN02910323_1054 [Selenomonas ruminantium]
MERIGLLAGIGALPVEIARAAKELGYEVYAVALLPDTDQRLRDYADDYQEINVLKVGKILKYLKKNDIHKVTMIGKVTKEVLFAKKTLPDLKAMQILMRVPDRKDDTIMLAIIDELRKIDVETFDQTELIRKLMPGKGVLTKRQPTEAERKDMEFGFQMAKEIGRMDVGQTVVVKDMAVMALEAIEGTDACILRGGKLAGGNAVVAKVAKPQQDSRFDVPTVGLKTLQMMVETGAKALAIEADATLLVERAEVIALAEANDITIMAM